MYPDGIGCSHPFACYLVLVKSFKRPFLRPTCYILVNRHGHGHLIVDKFGAVENVPLDVCCCGPFGYLRREEIEFQANAKQVHQVGRK